MSSSNQDRKYPPTLAGFYKNDYATKFVLNTVPLDRQRADEMCAMIQQCVGGRLEITEWGGVGKNGKALPAYKLSAITAEIAEERKAFVERSRQEPAVAAVQTAGDDAL